MDCNVIRDLIPLYIDECCSEESGKMVEEHICTCPACKAAYESMNAPTQVTVSETAPEKPERINDWKASILQSVLLFVSFAMITVGVALEAATPSGFVNGFWAVTLVIPAVGLLLSLANWYFLRLYRSRRAFSRGSWLTTLAFTVCGCLWAGFHYEFFAALKDLPWANAGELIAPFLLFFGPGILLAVVCCAASGLLSARYAAMLGKE